MFFLSLFLINPLKHEGNTITCWIFSSCPVLPLGKHNVLKIVCIHSTLLCDCNRIRMRVRVRALQLSRRSNATLHSKHVFIDFHIFKAGIARKLETPSASQSFSQSDHQTFIQSFYLQIMEGQGNSDFVPSFEEKIINK